MHWSRAAMINFAIFKLESALQRHKTGNRLQMMNDKQQYNSYNNKTNKVI